MSLVKSALIELHYLPAISYFSALEGCGEIIVEKFEHYEKQTYRNRCYINTSQGKKPLIVPLAARHGKILISEVRIDYTQKWLNNHWRSIQSAYGKAPFFEYYAEDLHSVLFSRPELLYELNFRLLTMCLRWLKWDVSIRETTVYKKEHPDAIRDCRSLLNSKKEDSCNRFFKSVEYHQVFGSKFVHNLSIIDLVFCEGPGARGIVQASVK